MKAILFFCLFLFLFAGAQAQNTAAPLPGARWKQQLHTALQEGYVSEDEKLVFYYLNLARTQPRYFADSVLKPYKGASGFTESYAQAAPYVATLYDHLVKMKPVQPLQPDRTLYTIAQCFADATGKSGAVGHDRKGTSCPPSAMAECCSYGRQKPLDIVLQLLIDNGVPSLGHRLICLGNYRFMGVSIQPHKTYRHTAVLNFK